MPDSPSASTSAAPATSPVATPRWWMRDVPRRWLRHFWLKSLGTPLFMTAFFVAYFAVLRHPRSAPIEVPLTAPDHWIAFQPAALLPYASLWLYAILPSSLMVRFRELIAHTIGAAALSVVGLVIFGLWPTTTPPAGIDWAAYPRIQFLKAVDATGNACPSLHVAFAIFSACWLARLLRRLGAGPLARGLNVFWAVLIVYSTLATRQHVFIDALAGALLGGLIACLNLRLCPDAPDTASFRAPAAPARSGGFASTRRFPFVTRFSLVHVALLKLAAVSTVLPNGLPFAWACVLFFGPDLWVLYHLFVPGASGIVRTVTRFETDRPEVWLTIDDGPDPRDTPRILDELDRHGARATFFLIGERAARHPGLVDEIARRGHEIGHHTQGHRGATFWCASPGRVRGELDAAFAALTSANGAPPHRFRPPVGIKNLFLAKALARRNLICVGWSIRSLDSFSRDPKKTAARVLRQSRPGSILLMHEGPPLHDNVRVTAIAQVLAGLGARGLRCVIPTDTQLR